MLVPADLTLRFSPGRTAAALPVARVHSSRPVCAAISNDEWGTSLTAANISPVAVALFQAQLPNGQYMIPWSDGQIPTPAFPETAISPGTAYFISDQAVINLDWNASTKDTLSAKYYYQHDPSLAPYAYSNVAGFAQRLETPAAPGGLHHQYSESHFQSQHHGSARHPAREGL